MRHRSFSLISVMWPWPLVPLCLPLTIPEPVHQSPPTQPPKQTHQSVRASAKHQHTVALLSTHKHTAESTVSSFPNDNYTLNSSTAVRMWFLSQFEKIRTMKHLSSYHKDFFYSNWHRSMTSNSFFFFFKKKLPSYLILQKQWSFVHLKKNTKIHLERWDTTNFCSFSKGEKGQRHSCDSIDRVLSWFLSMCYCGWILPQTSPYKSRIWRRLSAVSHRVVKHHVLFGQLQQHRIVEELADTHILAQTLQNNKHGDVSHAKREIDQKGCDKQVDKRLTLRLRVLIMNSLARWGAGCGSRGLITILLSRGSPGTIWKAT